MIESLEPTGKSCQGMVFKASAQNFTTARGGFGFSVRLVPMKRLSCPGCEKCGWLHDQMGEVSNDWPIIGIETAEDGELYTVGTCNHSTDWETGAIDSWDLCLIKFSQPAGE